MNVLFPSYAMDFFEEAYHKSIKIEDFTNEKKNLELNIDSIQKFEKILEK